MAMTARGGKLYDLFTLWAHHRGTGKLPRGRDGTLMVGLALAIFVALFGWGAEYFGWDDPVGKVQLALFTSFILGALCGYKSKG